MLGGLALMVAVASYLSLTFAGLKPPSSSRKAQQAKAMREAYNSMGKQPSSPDSKSLKVSSSFPSPWHCTQADIFQESRVTPGSMQISQVSGILKPLAY
jgi:hypothetical protein